MQQPAFQIRACTPADSSFLSLVACAAFLEGFAGFLKSADILAHCEKNNSPVAFEKYLRDEGMKAFLAEALPGNAPIGYVLLCEPDLPAEVVREGDYELKRIYLLHRFQGTAVGAALMEQAVSTACEMRKKRLLLGVNAQNERAIAFYRKSGFELVGERYFTVGATTHYDLVMGKPLT